MSTLIPVAAMVAAAVMIASAQPPQGKGKGDAKAPSPAAKGDAKADAKGKAAAAPAPVIVGLRVGFYEVTGLGGNTSVRVTSDGLIVADTKNLGEANYAALMNVIRTVSPLPVKYVIVTHVHQDHSGNTGSFIAAGAKVIANEGEKKELATYTMPAAGRVAEPNVTYPVGKNYKFKLGDTRVEVHNFGPAHTGGDSIVYFPDDKIVHSGDVVVGVAPNCDYPDGGSVANWPKVLDKILKLDFQLLIPGHGDPMTKDQVREYKKKWETFIARAVARVKMGTPKDKLLAAIKVDDIGWNTTSYAPAARLDPFYAEMQKLVKK
ncbi:MAG: MBL fold metallo-hydrolase [Acidobacteriota bacterium]